MATGEDHTIQSVEKLDDYVKCNICLDTLKEPKLLPCLHTFCKSCIRTYIESSKEKKNEILCPVCRQLVPAISGPDDVEALVEKLPENHFAVSLLNKASLGKSEKFCDSCKLDGTEVLALSWCGICEEALCKQCERCHRRFKISADHELIPIGDIGNNGDGAKFYNVIFCDDHQKSVVQIYCVDHKKACCTLCATLSHRKCEKVISVEEAASGIKQKPEVSELLKQMDENITLITDVINCREENETSVNTEATNIETIVTKFVKEMKDHLDKIQNKILSELDATKKQAAIKVADDISDFTSFKSALTNWKTMLSGVVKHGSDQQCLVIVNEITSKIELCQNELRHSLEKMRNASFKFKESEAVKNFECTIQSLGDLKFDETKIKYEKGILRLKTDFRNGEIKVIRTINVAPSGSVSGIFIDDLMLFTSYSTHKVIKYKRDGELLGELSIFPSLLTDLCHVADARVAISSYSPSAIYLVDCREMKVLQTMTFNNVPVWGVCVYDNNHFLVGYNNQLTWINQSSGTKLKSVKTSGQSFYLATSGNNDYIYGDGEHSVSYVVNDTKKFTYTNNQLSSPRGIGIDEEGNFYITGYNSNGIHQISGQGELIRIIPISTIGINRPWTLRFEPESNRFLATCYSTGKATLCEIE